MKKIVVRVVAIVVIAALAGKYSPLGEGYALAEVANVAFFVAVFILIDASVEKRWP